MSSDLLLELQLRLKDGMSAGAKRSIRGVQDGIKGLKREYGGLNKAKEAYEKLGIRSEKSIQREIQQTQAAYNRLARSGTLSSQQLARAKDAELRKTKELNAQLRTGTSLYQKMQNLARAGAAVAAGGYVVKRALDKPMAYDRQLALTANVAYSDRNVAGRLAGKKQLNNAVRQAQALGLGSQEEVLQTLNDLIGSGAMGDGAKGVKSSINLLPTIARASSGTGADPADIAKIVMAAKQNMGMTDAQVKQFISKSITAGNLGGFELKDMARYLPEQMASAAANGMKGMRGAEDLLAYNQVARITAGNPDQAGNNLVNLLNKINSFDTQKDFKKNHINLTGSLVAARAKGIGGLDAFMALVDRVSSKDPEYKKLKAQAAKQKGPEQQATYSAMMDIMEQKGLSSVVQDRQAMAALLAVRQQQAKLNEVRTAVRADKGGQIDTNFAVIDDTSSAAAERVANAKDASASGALSSIDGPLKRLLKTVADVTNANPVLAAAAYSAATALAAVAAASGVGSILKGGKGVNAAGKLARTAKFGGKALLGGAAVGGVAAEVGAVGALSSMGLFSAGPIALSGKAGSSNMSGAEVLAKSISVALAPLIDKINAALKIDLHMDGHAVATATTKQVARAEKRK